MHSNLGGLGAIEVEGVYRFQDVGSKLLPGITLREDGLGEAFRTVPTVGFLGYLEYQLVHNTTVAYSRVPSLVDPTPTGDKIACPTSKAAMNRRAG